MRLAAVVVLLALAGEAAADVRRAPAEIRAVLPGKTLAASTLVGRSGQRFVPRAAGGWAREGRGGVGCDVRDAFELSGTLWAVCSWAPLFSSKGGVWSARPLTNRGRTRVARAGSDVMLSIGRHVYAWSGDWKRRSSAPGRIKSLHAESPSQLFAVTTRGGLIRATGSRWRQVVAPPRRRDKSADPPARVFGSGKHSYAISEAGVVSLIGASSLAPIKLPDGISAIAIGPTAARAGGAVIAAAVTTRGVKRENVLATLDGSKLEIAPVPEGLAGARVSLVFELGGELLVATARGRAFVRDAAGAWAEKPLINELPPPKNASAANGGPARSR